jgi:hypothetical protein
MRALKEQLLPLKEQPIRIPTEEPTVETNTDLAVPDIDGAASGFAPMVREFTDHAAEIETLLKKDNISVRDVEVAKEYEDPAIQFLKAIDDPATSKLRRWATSLHELHRQVTGRMADLSRPAQTLRDKCSQLYRLRTNQVRARELEEQRKREAAERERIRLEREAQEAELAAQATPEATEQLEVLKETPLPEPVSPPSKSATKIAGVSIVYSAGWGEITDTKLFTKWLSEHPDEIAGFEPKLSYWKMKGTSHLNKDTGVMSIQIPGFKFAITDGSRRR